MVEISKTRYFGFKYIFCFVVVLFCFCGTRDESKAAHMPGKCPTRKPHPQSWKRVFNPLVNVLIYKISLLKPWGQWIWTAFPSTRLFAPLSLTENTDIFILFTVIANISSKPCIYFPLNFATPRLSDAGLYHPAMCGAHTLPFLTWITNILTTTSLYLVYFVALCVFASQEKLSEVHGIFGTIYCFP